MKREKLIGAPYQSIYDATLEAYGSIEGTRMLLEDNPSVISVANNIDGVKLNVREDYTDRENVRSIFSKRKPISG